MTNDVMAAEAPDHEAAEAEPADLERAENGSSEPSTEAEKSSDAGVTLSRSMLAGLVSLLAFLLAAAVVFGWLYIAQAGEQSDRDEALATARAYAVTVTSYDYRDMEGSIADVLDGATGEFKDLYAGGSDTLRALLKETKAVATGEVLDAAVVSADGDRVTVMLFIDQKVTNAGSKKTKIDRNRVLFTMEQNDDRWLLSKLQFK